MKVYTQGANVIVDMEDPNKELTKSLNLTGFDKGIYILRIITNDHFSSRKFVIK